MITLDAITLPSDLIWADEFDWTPANQQVSHTLSGALVVERSFKQAGRPITLQGGDNSAWALRSTIVALQAKLTTAVPMTLTLNDARTFSVAFDHSQTPIESRPVVDYSTPDGADYHTLTLRFIAL